MHSGYGFGNMMGSGGGFLWMLLWTVLLVGLVALIVWLVGKGSRSLREQRESPQAILKRRYAHGDIDEDEYHKHLEELRH